MRRLVQIAGISTAVLSLFTQGCVTKGQIFTANPSSAVDVVIFGETNYPNARVRIFKDPACTQELSTSKYAIIGKDWLISARVPENTTTTLYARDDDPYPKNPCFGVGDYTHRPPPSFGVNIFDLAIKYTSGDANLKKIAKKAIVDASNMGAKFARVAITGYGPAARVRNDQGDLHKGDLRRYFSDEASYWADIKEMLNDLDQSNVKIVPTFVWYHRQFPMMTDSDTVMDFLSNTQSASSLLLRDYIRKFITKYKNRSSVLFYELTNELSLGADIDMVGFCRQQNGATSPLCVGESNYTSDQLANFTRALALYIKQLDPNRKISSGFTYRNAAYHLHLKPFGTPGGPDWTPDTPEQFQEIIRILHQDIDIVSVHAYADLFFGKNSVEALTEMKKATDNLGKELFVGEFGERIQENNGTPSSLTVNAVKKIRDLNIPFGAPWILSFYQHAVDKVAEYTIDPALTPKTFQALQKSFRETHGMPDPTDLPPQLIIVKPATNTRVSGTLVVHAHASDEKGRVSKVELFVNGRKVGSDITAPPYAFSVSETEFSIGSNTVSLRATDASGKTNSASLLISK